MATYKGQDIAPVDQGDENLKLRGGRAPGLENTEEELNLPPEVGTERTRRPGEKGYMREKHMAENNKAPVPASMKGTTSFNKGGIVGPNVTKWGSPKVTAPCKDTKTIKCY